jgi:haloalkane dehalogenase
MERRKFLEASAGLAGTMLLSREFAGAKPREARPLDAKAFHKSRRFARLPYGRIAYVEQGHGPASLFLHGFPLNGFQWRGALSRLSKYRRCIAADFMGLGYTETPERQDISPSAQADMLAGLLDSLSIDSVDVIANDSGGEVAQLFVARYPGRVRTLLLTNCDVDTNSPPPSFLPFLEAARKGALVDGFARLLADKALARSPKGLGGFYTDPANLTDEAIDCYFAPLVSSPLRKAQCNRYAVSFEPNPLVAIQPALKRCPAPARIVWGAADTTFEASWAAWLDQTLPQSRGVRLIEGAKLFFPEEMPDIIAEEALTLWGVPGPHHG